MPRRGRPPKPIALHIAEGTYRRDRHRDRIDATEPDAVRKAPELSEAEIAANKAEIDAFRARLYGEAGPPDPGPRSGGVGTVRRIRW